MKKYKLYLVCAAALIVVAGAFFVYQSTVYRTEVSGYELTATTADAAGIAPSSHFILKTTGQLTAQVLEKYIKMIPSARFSVKKVSAADNVAGDASSRTIGVAAQNVFEIVPSEELMPDQIYTIEINRGPLADRDYSWAYQVRAPFQLVSSIPKDKATDVPTATGIELSFNRDGINDPGKYVEITPKVSGRYEIIQNKVSFIPNDPLVERTVYTVKIKAGMGAEGTSDTLQNETVIQFQTSQAYSSGRVSSVYFSRQFSEFKPGADISLGVSAYNASSATVDVYRFDTDKEFLNSVHEAEGNAPWARYYTDVTVSLPDNQKVLTGTLPIETSGYSSTIKLPQALPAGYYATILKSGTSRDISWFQVNPTASFAAIAGKRSLIWLKDIAGGTNLAGVPIMYDGNRVGTTGADGVALFDTPPDIIRKSTDIYTPSPRKFFVAEISYGTLVIPMENEYGSAAALAPDDAWWDYISFNKNIYLPTDTLRFWAIVKPRAGAAAGEDLNVKLTSAYWDESQASIVTYAETDSKVSAFNAVTGEVSFTNLKPGTYDLTFRKDGETVAKQTVTVGAYLKPAYDITVTPGKSAIFAGDSIKFDVKAELFDGTPFANADLSYSAYYNANFQGNLKLDSNGHGSFTISTKYASEQSYWPSILSVDVRPAVAEEGRIETSAHVFVFGPHIDNTIDEKQSTGRVDFTVNTRRVVFDDRPRGEPFWGTNDYLGGPVAGATTKADVSEIIYKKDQTGTGYDPINKLTYPIYNYTTEYKPLFSQTLLGGQDGATHYTFTPETEKSYRIIFTTYDEAGRIDVDTRYVYGGTGDVDYGARDSSYSLFNPDQGKNYKVGDAINLEIRASQGVQLPNKAGSYIFMLVNNGDLEYKLSDGPKFSSTFRDRDIPNVAVWPGWFSEGRFHSSYLENISFDANERRLKLIVTKDKQTYKPGDTVDLDLRVTDKDGHPVQAEVNLSALDQAVFAVKPDEKDIVSDLYRDIYSQLITRSSNMPPYGGGGAEKGGGDGDAPRSNIQEMAIFKSLTTDASGSLHVSFKLPDNITSWRLTAQAVTRDLFAGKEIYFIPVTLPLFVDATLNRTYLSGDDVTLRLRTFGTGAGGSQTAYSIQSPTLPFKEIDKVGGSSIEVPLGKLTTGDHELTIRAKNGGLSDAITRPLEVLDSYFTKNVSDYYDGTAGLKIRNSALGYTTLTFASRGKGLLYDELKNLSCSCGMRVDQKGTHLIAAQLLNEYFGEKNELPEFQAAKYQGYSGGIQLLPYSSDDLTLSAISSHLFHGSTFDQASLKNYLKQSLNDPKADISRVVRALYGLTAFDEPVLTKIESIKTYPSLTLTDKVFVALSLDAAGAKEEARTYYRQMVKPELVMKPSYAYVGGLSGDDAIVTTALVAALTSSLDEPESAKLAMYVAGNPPHETLDDFEQLLYIISAIPKLDREDVSFSYKAGSKEGTKMLIHGDTFELVLSPQELASFDLNDVKGDLGIVATYEEPFSPGSIMKDSDLYLGRSYETNGNPRKTFNEGDTVRVRLQPQFGLHSLTGAYEIVDYLPSGLRPIDQESNRYNSSYDPRVYPTEINDQKVTFVIDKNVSQPIYYYARVVSKGTYKAEPATLRSLRSLESETISNEDKITID